MSFPPHWIYWWFQSYSIFVLIFPGAALPDQVGTARNKLLSLILFLFWIIMGLICISRMSYNKFFLLMSSTFLVHAFFGPVWCIRRLAFCIGVCLWMGSLVSSKPIPAAVAVLIAFTLTGFRKWRKKVAMTTSTSHLLRFNESIEQRLDGIEKKLDLLVTKLNTMCDTQPSWKLNNSLKVQVFWINMHLKVVFLWLGIPVTFSLTSNHDPNPNSQINFI